MIEKLTAERLGLKIINLNKPITLSGFLGHSTDIQQLVEAIVKVGEVCLFCKLYVIDEHLGCECIIGRNFTENKNINYCRIGDELNFFYAKQKVHQISEIIELTHSVQIKKLLHDYRCVFSNSYEDLGQINCEAMEIKLTSQKPIFRNPYRMAETEKLKLNDIINQLLKAKIIQESRSPYASPVLLVKKNTPMKNVYA